jgi:hypothetical protein
MNKMTITIEPMTEKDIDNFIMQAETVARLSGFQSLEEMDRFKVDASEGMIRFGGGFAKPLGYALVHADSFNTAKLIEAFRDICNEHAQLWRKFIAKREEEQQ